MAFNNGDGNNDDDDDDHDDDDDVDDANLAFNDIKRSKDKFDYRRKTLFWPKNVPANVNKIMMPVFLLLISNL